MVKKMIKYVVVCLILYLPNTMTCYYQMTLVMFLHKKLN